VWQIECAEGALRWSSRGDKSTSADAVTIHVRGKRPRRVSLPELPYYDRAGALAAFAAAIREGTEPPASGRDNVRSLALMFAAIESAATGRTKAVDGLPASTSRPG
jgi:predicted dehydrogenase